MDPQDTSNDHAHADARGQDHTPDRMQRNSTSAAQTPRTMGTTEPTPLNKRRREKLRPRTSRPINMARNQETEIARLIERNREIPEELGLEADGSQKLAGIFPEYSPRKLPNGTCKPGRSASRTSPKVHMRELRKTITDADREIQPRRLEPGIPKRTPPHTPY